MSGLSQQPRLLELLKGYDDHPIVGQSVGDLVSAYHDLLELLPRSNGAAILEPSSSNAPQRRPLTHNVLHNFIEKDFDLTRFGIPNGTRIGVILPNGPELAVTIVGVVSRWCAAPINPSNTWQEIKSELESTKSQVIIVQSGTPHESALYAAGALGLGVIELTPSADVCGLFSLAKIKSTTIRSALHPPLEYVSGFVRYNHPETVLLLHTSGTSGNKKLVPYSLDMLIVGVGCIVSSWKLTPNDVCLNMMPLFHIGGIVRNVFSPILSGGTVVACSAFDPVLFWDVLSSQRITSYYAAPTMHHAILMEADRRPKPLPVQSVRFIANAAGGLLPALADALKRNFSNAVILTSYGMTECMPISSPPLTYKMDPVGTSGTLVGPAIKISADNCSSLPVGQQGNILIRGPPCFGGYEGNASATEEAFFVIDGQPGWFNTGDVGHLDEQGYLFISGRSKEIINRGGETISPLEIEEALIQHPLVQEALAFSAPHFEFQETVGVVVVSKPGHPRVDLLTLHKYLDDRLHRSKWPQVLVYMPALPKNAAGKILRIRLGERLRLKPVNEDSPLTDRIWEVPKPVPVSSSLSSLIDVKQVFPNPATTIEFIKSQFGIRDAVILSVDLPSNRGCFVACVTPASIDTAELTRLCAIHLHRYLVPAFFCALDRLPILARGSANSTTPEESSKETIILSLSASKQYENMKIDELMLLKHVMDSYASTHVIKPRDELEAAIEAIWRSHLSKRTELNAFSSSSSSSSSLSTISIMDNFFDLGGDSLKAGQLINAMRKQLSVQGLTVPDLFSAPTISAMAKKIASLGYKIPPSFSSSESSSSSFEGAASLALATSAASATHLKQDDGDSPSRVPFNLSASSKSLSDSSSPFGTPSAVTSSKSFAALALQAFPMLCIYPARKMAVWFFVAQPWVLLMDAGVGRLRALVIAMIIARVMTGFIFPLFGVLCKWVLVGRYRAGKYPLWGSMYLRWWLTEQTLQIFGKGYFAGSMPIFGNSMLVLYYRMLGAKIGRNVKISKGSQLGQPDLVDVGDDVIFDDAVVRPFSLEERHMVLLPIKIGNSCSVGARSVVASGTTLPDNTHIGPQSSSHELGDAVVSNRKYCRPLFSQPPLFLMLFLGFPILLLVTVISYLPWYFVLRSMENEARQEGWYMEQIHTLYDAFVWWCKPQRLPYYFALRILRKIVVPPIQLLQTIFIKKVIIGKFTACDRAELETPWNRFRYWLMRSLIKSNDLCGVAPLVGKHYEIISIIYRLLGSKIGQRVYWPGSGFDVVDYDLLEVGNDVVFGSRSVIMTRSTERAATVVIGDSAMLADRCVVLPGATLAKGSVLGTGALARENYHYPMGSVWVGSTKGNAVAVFPEDTSLKSRKLGSAFGKAFYEKKANFFVIPLWLVVLYNTVWHIFCCVFHNLPPVLAIYVATYIGHVNRGAWIMEVTRTVVIYGMPIYFVFGLSALLVDIAAKWAILGRRQPGLYPWDKSSYCQRWQLYLTIQDIRRGDAGETGMLELLQGSQYIVWYFQALGCSIGKEVCLYPNGANPMMTEPELVRIENYAAIDDASLIGHLNTKGVFSLSELSVGEGCVLKTGSRLMSGASMGYRGILLEHTLILSGDQVSPCSVWQGWPSKVEMPLETYHRRLEAKIARSAAASAEEDRDSPASSWWCFLEGRRARASRLPSAPMHHHKFRRSEKSLVASSDAEEDEEAYAFLTSSEVTYLLASSDKPSQQP